MKTLRIDTTKKFKHYGEKIKQVQFHPTQPLLLAAQFNGKITIFNYELQSISKQIDVSDKPLRTAIWISDDRILTSGDDLYIRIYSFHTTQKLIQFQAHNDFIRRVLFNPLNKELISCSDEKNIILWEFDEKNNTYLQKSEWKEHTHFVMDLKFNPKEDNCFTTCSLDKTIKVWNSKSDSSSFTLRGHDSGVNCIAFYNQDKYLLISGSDDFQVIVWDFSSRVQLRNIKKHNGNVMDVIFSDKIPFFVSLAEDGYLNFYGLKNYEFSFDIVNFMNKGWSLSSKNNLIAAAYDEGCVVIQLGNDKPISSTSKGKLTWSTNGEVFSVNLKAIVAQQAKDMEILDSNIKETGVLQIFPNKVEHNENGQFISFFDGQEYYIYKSLSFKLQLYGDAKEFCWGPDKKFATINDMNELVIQTINGEVLKSLNFDFYIEKIFGGKFIGIAGNEFVLFYDWQGEKLIGKIDVEMQDIYWHENSFILKNAKQTFLLDYVADANEEEIFSLRMENNEQIYHGFWQNHFYFYIDNHNKFKILISGKPFTLASFKDSKVICDYLKNQERFFFFDNSSNITSFKFSKNLFNIFENHLQNLEECDFNLMELDCQNLNSSEKDFIAKILVTFEHKESAFNIVSNIRTKFELAIELNFLKEAINYCKELKEPIYWKKLGDFAMLNGKFQIAEEAYLSCEDTNSLMMLASCLGNRNLMIKVGKISMEQKHYSVAFIAFLNCQQLDKCLEILLINNKFSQALIFCKNYIPSKITQTYEKWKSHLSTQKSYLAQKIANPNDYPEEYPELQFLIDLEIVVSKNFNEISIPSQNYLTYQNTLDCFDFYSYAKENGLDSLDTKLQELTEQLK